MRMKLIRDGYEDYEWLRWLTAHGQGAQARAVVRSLFPRMFDTNRTDGAVQAARAQLAALASNVTG